MDTSGTYTSAERVERGGRLVAFAGETMTMVEAARRGLIGERADKATGKQKAPTRDELAARCKDLGISVPSKATKVEIEKILANADTGTPDDVADGQHGPGDQAC